MSAKPLADSDRSLPEVDAAAEAVAAAEEEAVVAAAEEEAAAGWEGVASLQGSVRRELG